MRRDNQRLEIEPAREGSADALRRLSRSPGRRRQRSTILSLLRCRSARASDTERTFKIQSMKPMTTFIRPR